MSLVRLEVTPLPVMISEILQDRGSGMLSVLRAPRTRVLYWTQGDLSLVSSNDPAESLWQLLVQKGLITPEQANELQPTEPLEVVLQFQKLGLLDAAKRQVILREWLRNIALPLFSLEEGTATFQRDEAIDPDRRILVQSTPALVVEGIRSISNGLVLRNSLGNMKRPISVDPSANLSIDMLPLTEAESRIANSLTGAQTVEEFLRRFSSESLVAAKVVIMMTTLGVFHEKAEEEVHVVTRVEDDPQRDMELLAAIGPNDIRSRRAISLARSLGKIDFYRFLDMASGSTTSQLVERCEWMRKEYDPASFPPAIRDLVRDIVKTAERAMATMSNPARRQEYDRMLAKGSTDSRSVEQQTARKSIARQNFQKAQDLSVTGDYYGAIVLLKQAVNFEPTNADAWLLLGNCQEKNPRWRRDAANSYQKALSANPNSVEALLSLGDLYRLEGLAARAQNYYEDVLRIEPDHEVAKKRIKAIK